jgi:3-isopropylmalate dehydrogenase
MAHGEGPHRVGIVGGDGIGPDVIREGLKVIAAAGVELDTVDYDLGGDRYLKDGVVLSDEMVDEWRDLDAI